MAALARKRWLYGGSGRILDGWRVDAGCYASRLTRPAASRFGDCSKVAIKAPWEIGSPKGTLGKLFGAQLGATGSLS